MSKLLKLKQWLTIEETAKYLTSTLGEEVAASDIFRLALDGHLTLSMHFPNKAHGNLGRISSFEDARKIIYTGVIRGHEMGGTEGEPKVVIAGDVIGDDQIIDWDDNAVPIDGVWDLMMVASECLDVEHIYQALTSGPEITLTNLAGTFLRRGDEVCRLVESWEQNEFCPGSLAYGQKLELSIQVNKLPSSEVEKQRMKYKEERQEYLNKKKAAPRTNDFYPAGGLPTDGVYVVRMTAIADFLDRINATPKHDKPITTKERNSLLTLIAALCNKAGYDYSQRGIASSLAASAENLGKPLGEDTIRKILKQVKDLYQ
ncbi:MAG: hypothetical protein NVV73_14870 [Cellvibrionaceae bacterium]|nr:hypothetical protein [Cellvibrionaceae bacterium]